MTFYVCSIGDAKPMDAKKLFGKDSLRLAKCCRIAAENELGGSKSYQLPAELFQDWRQSRGTLGLKDFVDAWFAEHPQEKKIYFDSKKSHERKVQRVHYRIYDIAKRHSLHVRWLGRSKVACYPDQWIISKAGKDIGIIHTM